MKSLLPILLFLTSTVSAVEPIVYYNSYDTRFVNVVGDEVMSGDLSLDNLIVRGTATIQGSEFSVGGSTFIVTGGMVGINTSTPTQSLSFGGDASINLDTTNAADNKTLSIFANGGNLGAARAPYISMAGNEVATVGGRIRMVAGNDATGHIRFEAGGTERMRIAFDGKIGISTSSPSEKLHIKDGSIRISTTTGSEGIIFQDNSEQIIAYAPIYASSEPAHSPSVASTSYVAVATVTINNIGGKHLRFDVCFVLSNLIGEARTYDIDLRENGVQNHTHTHTTGGNDDASVSIFDYEVSSTAGSREFSLWIKSSNATGTQEIKDIHLLVRED